MSDLTSAVLHFIGGATVGFRLPGVDIDRIRQSLDYAVSDVEMFDGPPGSTDRLPALRYVGDARPRHRTAVRHDTARRPSTETIDGGVDGIIDDLHLTIALHADDSIFIHAGVVAVAGRAILLPGRSHVGKSTLVDALVRHGADYLSDEYARVTPDGWILPYPRPIHLRVPSGRLTVDPATIGRVTTAAVPPALVVATRYEPGAVFEPRHLPPARAALELFDNAVAARTSPDAAMAAVTSVARSTRAVRTLRPDAAVTAPALLDLAGSLVDPSHDTMDAT